MQSISRSLVTILPLAALLFGAAHAQDETQPTTTSSLAPSPTPFDGTSPFISLNTGGLNTCQRSLILQQTNQFENSRNYFAFDYCENISDGRGYTCGIVGFTTGTTDAFLVIDAYTKRNGGSSEFDPYYNRLRELYNNPSGSTSGLNGFCRTWGDTAANSTLFRQIQVETSEALYWNPSMVKSDELGLKLAASRGFVYDSFIQHGNGTDADSAISMISRVGSKFTASSQPGTPAQGLDEITWLVEFFAERNRTLLNPANQATRKAWSSTTYRSRAYSYIVNNGQSDFNQGVSLRTLNNDGSVINLSCLPDIWTTFIPVGAGGDSGGDSGLSTGAKVGIAIAVIVIVVGGGIGAWIWYRRRQSPVKAASYRPYSV
ncbi:lysozyme-like domain-containing protein [Cladochytrium replicatum]|nr:lysozyme-like domain-containing protein [Cladochytrium replicatum]